MTIGETIALTRWTFVGKVMSPLFSMKYRFFIAFLFIEGLFSCFYIVEGLKELYGAFFIRALIPFMRAPFSSSNHLPKTPPPNAIALGFRVSTYGFEGIQTLSIAVGQIVRDSAAEVVISTVPVESLPTEETTAHLPKLT